MLRQVGFEFEVLIPGEEASAAAFAETRGMLDNSYARGRHSSSLLLRWRELVQAPAGHNMQGSLVCYPKPAPYKRHWCAAPSGLVPCRLVGHKSGQVALSGSDLENRGQRSG